MRRPRKSRSRICSHGNPHTSADGGPVESSPPSARLDVHDLSLLRFLERRVERVRLGPAVYRRVESVRDGSPRADGSFGHVRIDAQV